MPSTFLKKVAQDTNEYVKAKKWHKGGNTQQYILFPLPSGKDSRIILNTNVEVVNDDYISVAYANASNYSRVAILNMCSDRVAGGGYLKGSTAAEEELCRRTNLFPQLQSLSFPLAHDSLFYSSGIKIFKKPVTYEYLADVRSIDVISIAAVRNPRLTHDKRSYADRDTETLMRKKIYAILKLAESQNVDCLVLSAFGCGAFRNPPNTVAKLFMEYLAHFSFKKVVFAIIDNTLIGRTTSNYKIFQKEFSEI